LGRQNGWNIIVVTGISIVVLVACYILLQAAITRSARERETQGTMF